mmetsp:Transcript_47871/g.150397  ORF Transcript_47871/g.150397 Transcript_47871/m.150397 type:complete len:247 (+) Transcript_47871:38-778(+)
MLLKFALLILSLCHAAPLPSCESDTSSHCLGDGADLSPEGIEACLQALGEAGRSAGCNAYLSMLAGCGAEIGSGGVCAESHMNGETAACLVQRTPEEQLSEGCRAALPEKEEAKGLYGIYWKDGKRELDEDEVGELLGEELDTYLRWIKRKKGKKTDRGKERDYAVRTAKKAAASKQIVAKAEEAARAAKQAGEGAKAQQEAAMKAAEAAAADAVATDMTKTLKPFTRSNIKAFAAQAVKQVKDEL